MLGRNYQKNPTLMIIYFKVCGLFSHYDIALTFCFSDFFLSTEFIPKRRQWKWINREGFCTRKMFILKWIFLGNILTMGYKCTLLSTLIPIHYENTIDTLSDLDLSGLPLVTHRFTAPSYAIADDPRQVMKRIDKRSSAHPYGKVFEKYLKM